MVNELGEDPEEIERRCREETSRPYSQMKPV